MLDHYLIGDANRISPEAPVPVVVVEKENYVLGAAANVALNILSLGGDVELCGSIGSDRAGEQISKILSNSTLSFNSRFIKNHVNTIVKTRVVVRGQQLCRIDYEGNKSIYNIDDDSDINYIESRIKQCDAVILSDYNKGVFDNHNVEIFIQLAKKYNKFIAIDPKPSNNLKYKNVDLMTPNKLEAYELAGKVFSSPEDGLESICEVINAKYSPKHLIVTLGAEGMLLSINGDIKKTMPTYSREVFDVSGAGDTVIAALVLAMSSGIPVYDAMHFANLAAGVVVGKSGTGVAFPDEIIRFEQNAEYFSRS